MSKESQTPEPAPRGEPATPSVAELKAQCENLRQVVQALEQEKNRDAEALAAAQADLKQFQDCLYAWARQQTRPEDWQDFREEEYTVSAEEVLADLEKQEQK
jgi:aminoglycoside N3'-acetyltransferase